MKKFDSINVIPFIDIMLVLLAIVLATASFISQGKIEVNVPQSQSKVPVQATDLAELITITKTGDYFYQDQPITLDKLDSVLAGLTPQTKITIKIDADSSFQQFVHVTDLLTKYALKKVAVVTAKPTPTIAPTTNSAPVKATP